jgi:hypothetical protein
MRHIDHLVVAVRDLDAAGVAYTDLGFQVGARNRHPWGTENRIIQFPRAFIELITVAPDAEIPPHAPGRFSFGAFVRDYLAKREGLAMLVLGSEDAEADAAEFAAKGIGAFAPFHFARTGRAPDGTETRVAFTLAFAVDEAAPEAGFFTCQQHFPEAFWNPRLQTHPNGATGIAAVEFGAPEPTQHMPFLAAFTGSVPQDMTLPLDGGAIRLAVRDDARFTGFGINTAKNISSGDGSASANLTVATLGTHISFEALSM